MAMVLEALLQWLHEGRILAGRLVATAADRSAWVGIYPLSLERAGTREMLKRAGIAVLPGSTVRAYRVRTFEIPNSLKDTSFSEAEIENKQSAVVLGDDALFEKLKELGVDVGILDSPRLVDYPL